MFQSARPRSAAPRLRPAALRGHRAAASMLRLSSATTPRLPTAASLGDWVSRAAGSLQPDLVLGIAR